MSFRPKIILIICLIITSAFFIYNYKLNTIENEKELSLLVSKLKSETFKLNKVSKSLIIQKINSINFGCKHFQNQISRENSKRYIMSINPLSKGNNLFHVSVNFRCPESPTEKLEYINAFVTINSNNMKIKEIKTDKPLTKTELEYLKAQLISFQSTSASS